MGVKQNDQTPWSEVEWTFVMRGHCPHCSSTKYKTNRSINAGNGNSTQLCVCRRCHRRFKLAIETPSGSETPNFGV